MSGRRAIGPGTAAGYGSVAAIWLGQGPAPFGWAAIGGDTATIMFGSAAAGGSRINVSVVPGAGGYDLPGGYPWSVKTTACRVVSSSAAGVLALLIVSCWAGAGAHRARKPTDPGRVAGSSRSPSR